MASKKRVSGGGEKRYLEKVFSEIENVIFTSFDFINILIIGTDI
jgi:hypothetical protein